MHWNKASGKWEAKIRIDGKRRVLGYFADEEEAAAAHHNAAAAVAAGRPIEARARNGVHAS